MSSFASDLSSKLVLNDGTEMPLFGYGTSKIALHSGITEATREVTLEALKLGYRLIDTAQRYQTEAGVGMAIKEAGIPREDVFVVSKIWLSNMGSKRCVESVVESLEVLGVDYVDLFLVHCPCPNGQSVATYQALLDCKEKGLIRSVGVSNFDIVHLNGLKEAGCPLPSVNQIELNPFFRQSQLVEYCRQENISVMGYSPLSKGTAMDDTTLKAIAHKHKKSVAQTMIRWSVQNGFITIPKSAKFERISDNKDVFDFSLDRDDLTAINKLPENACAWTPYLQPWLG